MVIVSQFRLALTSLRLVPHPRTRLSQQLVVTDEQFGELILIGLFAFLEIFDPLVETFQHPLDQPSVVS